MNKSLLQKKFRFVMIIAALAFFITIVTPVYFRSSANKTYPSVIMMWTVLFGAGGGKVLDKIFNFSWIGFMAYLFVIVLLIICLARKFITVDNTKDAKKGSIAVDAICMVCCLIPLVLFILLPITLSSASTTALGEYVVSNYAWGITYILAYIILTVMFISSLIVLYAEVIVKFKKIKDKKETKKENNE